MYILEKAGDFYIISEDLGLKEGPFKTTTDALDFWNNRQKDKEVSQQ